MSLAAPEFEFDYYDYNVSNAGAAPGSYLGMDPAFLVWIPPLEEGDIIKEMDEKHHFDEILPKQIVDPGSNTESPEDFNEQLHIARSQLKTEENTPHSSPRIDRRLAMKTNIVHPLNFSISDLAPNKRDVPFFEMNRKSHKNEKCVSIPMKEFPNNKYQQEAAKYSESEKEPYCEKSPKEHKKKYSDISDIQFADDDSDGSEYKYSDENLERVKDNTDSNKVMNI